MRYGSAIRQIENLRYEARYRAKQIPRLQLRVSPSAPAARSRIARGSEALRRVRQDLLGRFGQGSAVARDQLHPRVLSDRKTRLVLHQIGRPDLFQDMFLQRHTGHHMPDAEPFDNWCLRLGTILVFGV